MTNTQLRSNFESLVMLDVTSLPSSNVNPELEPGKSNQACSIVGWYRRSSLSAPTGRNFRRLHIETKYNMPV